MSTTEKYIGARSLDVQDYELFPTKSEFNFSFYSNNKRSIFFGSVMPEMSVQLNVGYYELNISNREFNNRFCSSCSARGRCDKDLEVYKVGECIYGPEEVCDWDSNIVELELPKVIILRKSRSFFLLTYEPNSEVPHKPLDVFNVFKTGSICWGNNKTPSSLRNAWSRFWQGKFNYDLTRDRFRSLNYISKSYLLKNLHKDKTFIGNMLLTLTPENILEPCQAAVVFNEQVFTAEQQGKRLYFEIDNQMYYYELGN